MGIWQVCASKGSYVARTVITQASQMRIQMQIDLSRPHSLQGRDAAMPRNPFPPFSIPRSKGFCTAKSHERADNEQVCREFDFILVSYSHWEFTETVLLRIHNPKKCLAASLSAKKRLCRFYGRLWIIWMVLETLSRNW